MTTTTVKQAPSRTIPAERPAPASRRGGMLSALDSASVAAVLAALPSLATWPEGRTSARRLVLTTDRMLEWLQPLADQGWQARWECAEELYGPKWHAWPVASAAIAAGAGVDYRKELTRGLGCLIKLRLVKPSYTFLTGLRIASDAIRSPASYGCRKRQLCPARRRASRIAGPDAAS